MNNRISSPITRLALKEERQDMYTTRHSRIQAFDLLVRDFQRTLNFTVPARRTIETHLPPGVVMEEVIYPALEPETNGRCLLALPDSPHPAPIIVVPPHHGSVFEYGTEKVFTKLPGHAEAFPIGEVLLRNGIGVITFDLEGFGTRAHFANPQLYGNGNGRNSIGTGYLLRHNLGVSGRLPNLLTSALWDIHSVLHIIRSDNRIEKSKLGIGGFSQGGILSIIAAALIGQFSYVFAHCAVGNMKARTENMVTEDPFFVIPNLYRTIPNFDFQDLVETIAPRPLLIVGGTSDLRTSDQTEVVTSARRYFEELGAGNQITYEQFDGGHIFSKAHQENIILPWLRNLLS